MNGGASDAGQAPPDDLASEELCVAFLKEEYPTWRDAMVELTARAPARSILAPPRPIFIWMIESGDLDTDVNGADDPADQVYFALRDGLIKIGSSGRPSQRLSRASTLTRTIVGGTLQEAMLQNLFSESQVWRDDRPERSSAEWYRPTPFLVKLANAEEALTREAADSLFAQFWRERHPDGLRIQVPMPGGSVEETST